MRVTRQQLRRIIREAVSTSVREDAINSYENWVDSKGHLTPNASSVLATYAFENRIPSDVLAALAETFGMDIRDVEYEIRQMERGR